MGQAQPSTELEELKARLAEAEETIEAIRRGAVDALVVTEGEGANLFTLRSADHAYRVVFETMNEGAATVTPDTTVLFCNSKLAGILKTSMEKIIAIPFTRFVISSQRQTFESMVARSLGGPVEGEFRLEAEDRSLVVIRASACPLEIDDARAICLVVTDVTEQKAAEERLRESEDRFRAIFENAQDSIFIKDRSLRYVQANPAMGKLLGLGESEIIGRDSSEIFGRDAGLQINEIDARVLSGQSAERIHTVPVRGVPMTFHDVTVPLRDQHGEVIGLCGISRNITDLTKASRDSFPSANGRYPSDAMRLTMKQAEIAASTDIMILLLGESGSGKDFLARWVHEHSKRAACPYFVLNCAAFPRELAESELFGHEAGAFTGAQIGKKGLVELAEGGTLLLNEIGELPLASQSKLLTFLDSKSFVRVGGTRAIQVDVRLIAATHRDLEREVAEGLFLEPLYHRLNVFPIKLPRLRDRIEDLDILVQEILERLAVDMQLSEVPRLAQETLAGFAHYDWPGNVRELRNALERTIIVGGADTFREYFSCPGRDEWRYAVDFRSKFNLEEIRNNLTSALCHEALKRSKGNRTKAAQFLGISRAAMYRLLKRRPDKDSAAH